MFGCRIIGGCICLTQIPRGIFSNSVFGRYITVASVAPAPALGK